MTRIRISTYFPTWPLERQLPGGGRVWGECEFLINQKDADCDWWVVLDSLSGSETAHCPRRNTILVTCEPPTLARYPDRYLQQFASVITCHRNLRHPSLLLQQQALPWWIGAYHGIAGRTPLTYDDLKTARYEKTHCLSVISSNQTLTRGHRLRLAFVEALKARLKDRVDVYGRGIRAIDDKIEAIAPYKYHIAIENSQFEDYWTEKLSDSFLGGAFPFYHGCPNIGRYFDAAALLPICISDIDRSIDAIEAAIEDGTYEKALPALEKARLQCLDEYNLFPMLAGICVNGASASESGPVTIHPRDAMRSGVRKLIQSASRLVPGSVRRWFK